MDTIFMFCCFADPYGLLLNLADKINLKRNDKYVALSNLSMSSTWKNINNKFKISAPTWNEKFDLPNGSYSVPDIQNFLGICLRKTWIKD